MLLTLLGVSLIPSSANFLGFMARPERLVLAESAAAAAEFGVSVDSGSSGLAAAAGVAADADGVDTVAAGVLAACKVCMGKAFSKSFPILKHPFDKFFIRGTRLLAGRTLSVGFQKTIFVLRETKTLRCYSLKLHFL